MRPASLWHSPAAPPGTGGLEESLTATPSPAPRRAPLARPDARLFLTSLLVLYAELLCIRWMPAHVRFLSYFTNFILLAALLGQGVGILAARRRPAAGLGFFPLLLLVITALVAAVRFELVVGGPNLIYFGVPEGAGTASERVWVLPAFFTLVALLFVELGRPLGTLLLEVTPPLRAYALDVGGSLAGIAAFFLLSLSEQPPAVWFAGLALLASLLASPGRRTLTVLPVLAALAIAGVIGAPYWWSPYYKIGLTRMPANGWMLNVNEISHQAMLPSELKEPFYHLPHEVFGDPPFRRVLVIGAGSGSDVAVALRAGAERVDAVEIDPTIARLGRAHHLERPFADPRAHLHIDDGRAFFKKSGERYDLIVFALTDSLTLTSQFASLRLESFLFTRESFAQAREHLAEDGALVLYNYYRQTWLLRKLAAMLESTFGDPPFAVSYGGEGRAAALLSGPRIRRILARRPELAHPYVEGPGQGPTLVPEPPAAAALLPWPPQRGAGLLGTDDRAGDSVAAVAPSATDDWPLLYLRARGLPSQFAAGLAMVAAVALAMLLALAPREARSGFDAHMFFLGAAFMLLETRSLVTFALLFGSTWMVNSLVFFAILLSVLVAIFVSARSPRPPSFALYGVLLAALLLAYLVPTGALLAIDPSLLRYGLASALAFLPIFLANLVFAGSFKVTGRAADIAFASNLLGIMAGGMMEYAALAIGYRNLLVLVMAFYALSALLMPRRTPVAKPAPGL